jgi:hypothetical protein
LRHFTKGIADACAHGEKTACFVFSQQVPNQLHVLPQYVQLPLLARPVPRSPSLDDAKAALKAEYAAGKRPNDR